MRSIHAKVTLIACGGRGSAVAPEMSTGNMLADLFSINGYHEGLPMVLAHIATYAALALPPTVDARHHSCRGQEDLDHLVIFGAMNPATSANGAAAIIDPPSSTVQWASSHAYASCPSLLAGHQVEKPSIC